MEGDGRRWSSEARRRGHEHPWTVRQRRVVRVGGCPQCADLRAACTFSSNGKRFRCPIRPRSDPSLPLAILFPT
jgi:hypothetical protein